MRLFIAVLLPDETKKILDTLILQLTSRLPGWRWIPIENVHLTLKFIGDKDNDKFCFIQQCLTAVLKEKKIGPMQISLETIGVFPPGKRPTVLWCGVTEPSDSLIKLVDDLETELEKYGIPKEKRTFVPHISLARSDKNDPHRFHPKILQIYEKRVFATFQTSMLSLMESALTKCGPVYKEIFQVAF
ncbi:MAG: RNA 2',3'-cyclic phosphodiesterase [Chlamydiota bacterium]|nr:RNA 2',3'-cyclic phosphodiesterase [Chlamydiota bacterium]